MGAVNWGIIKSPETQGIPMPQQAGFTQATMSGLEQGRAAGEAASENALRAAQTAIAQQNLKTLPEQQQLELEQSRQGLKTEAIKQKGALQDLDDAQLKSEITKMSYANHGFGGISTLSSGDIPTAYNKFIPELKKRGIDVNGMPQKYEDDPRAAQIAIKKGFAVSDWGLKKYENELQTRRETQVAETKGQADIAKAVMQEKLKMAGAAPEAYGKKAATDFAAMQTEANAQAIGARKTQETVNNLREVLKGATVKGALVPELIAKRLPGGAAAFKAKAELMIDTIRSLKGAGNRVMATEFATLDKMFPDASTNQKAAATVLDWLDAANTRSEEYSKFVNALARKGVADTGTTTDLWNKFLDENPFVNAKGQVVKDNVYKWKNYVTADAIKGLDKAPETTKTIGETTYIQKNGKWYTK